MNSPKHYLVSEDKNCRLQKHQWVCPTTHYPNLDTLHRKSRGVNCWMRFRCNDPACKATMEILWNEAAAALGIR